MRYFCKLLVVPFAWFLEGILEVLGVAPLASIDVLESIWKVALIHIHYVMSLHIDELGWKIGTR